MVVIGLIFLLWDPRPPNIDKQTRYLANFNVLAKFRSFPVDISLQICSVGVFSRQCLKLKCILPKISDLLAVGDVETYGKSKNEVSLAVSK